MEKLEKTEDKTDAIPESRAARWAYHLAVIPIFGFFLYTLASFVALYRIGQGRTGFFWLRTGFWRMLRMTFAGVLGCAACWFCPFYDSDKFEDGAYYGSLSLRRSLSFWSDYNMSTGERQLSNDVEAFPFGVGLKMRNIQGKRVKIGKWHYRTMDYSIKFEGNYSFGKKHGMWTFFYGNGIKVAEIEYMNGKPTHNWSRWYSDGQIKNREETLADGKTYKYSEWYRNGTKRIEGRFVLIERGRADWLLQLRRGDFSLRGYGTSNIPEIKLDQHELLSAEVGKWQCWDEKGCLVATDFFNDSGIVVDQKPDTNTFYLRGTKYTALFSFPSVSWTAVDIGKD